MTWKKEHGKEREEIFSSFLVSVTEKSRSLVSSQWCKYCHQVQVPGSLCSDFHGISLTLGFMLWPLAAPNSSRSVGQTAMAVHTLIPRSPSKWGSCSVRSTYGWERKLLFPRSLREYFLLWLALISLYASFWTSQCPSPQLKVVSTLLRIQENEERLFS